MIPKFFETMFIKLKKYHSNRWSEMEWQTVKEKTNRSRSKYKSDNANKTYDAEENGIKRAAKTKFFYFIKCFVLEESKFYE